MEEDHATHFALETKITNFECNCTNHPISLISHCASCMLSASHCGLLSTPQTCHIPSCYRVLTYLFPQLFDEFVPTYSLDLSLSTTSSEKPSLWSPYKSDSFVACSFRTQFLSFREAAHSAILFSHKATSLSLSLPVLLAPWEEAEPGFAHHAILFTHLMYILTNICWTNKWNFQTQK